MKKSRTIKKDTNKKFYCPECGWTGSENELDGDNDEDNGAKYCPKCNYLLTDNDD